MRPTGGERPRLYHNDGDRFTDVTREIGLDRVWLPMGSNFGDIDNDGFLDFYLGTGSPPYSYVVPNVLMHNVRRPPVRGRDHRVGHWTSSERARNLVRRLGPRWRPRPVPRVRWCGARGQGAQRPLPKPWPRQSLAELAPRSARGPTVPRSAPGYVWVFLVPRPAIRTLR